MRTPEEIKKGLKCCSKVEGCKNGGCPYYELGSGSICIPAMAGDALAYIQRLEETIDSLKLLNETMYDEAKKGIQELESRLAQAERERDAAVSDISRASAFLCRACRKNDWPNCEAGRNNLDPDDVIECDDFEWRGVCP